MTVQATQPHATLSAAVAALSEALRTADAVQGQGLCAAEGWRDEHGGLIPLFRQAERMPLELRSLEEPRVEARRGAVRVALVARGLPSADVWLVFQQDREGGWKCLALTESTAAVSLFVTGRLDRFPRWRFLAGDEAVCQVAEQVKEAVGAAAAPPKNASVAAWTSLTAPSETEGLDVRVGRVAALPEVGRAAFQVLFTDPSDDFQVEERWGIVERAGPEAPWVLRECAFLGTISVLLDGLEAP